MSVGSAYKIAVQIALTQNVTRGLAMMATHFKAVNADVLLLQQRLAAIGKMSLVGGGLVAAGGFGLKMLEEPLKKAMEYERYVATMRQQGLGTAQIDDAKKYVQATDIINTSALDRMRIFAEAQGAFRESGKSGSEALQAAKAMLPVLSTYEVALSTLSGSKHAAAEGAMRNLNKTVEMMGGLGDTNRAKEIADGVFKAVQSSGKMVDERQLKQFFAYGSSSTNQQSLRTVFGALEPIIGELGGSTTAVGMRTAYTRTNGMLSKPPKLLLHEMERLGMTDSTGFKQNDQLAELQSTNVIGYAQEIMQRYEKAGIKSQTDRERENAIIFGTNGSKVFNKIMSQMAVLEESLHAYDKAQGASEVVGDPQNKALLARQRYEKKLEDLQLVLAQDGGLIDMATRALTAFGTAISNVTEFAKAHPLLTKIAVGGLALVSTLAIVGGGILLFRAAVSALFILFRFGAIGNILKMVLPGIGTALGFVARAALFVGRALLLNPIGLAITAIATAAYLLWKNWDTVGPKLTAVWDTIKSAVGAFFDWVVEKWNWIRSFLPGGSDTPKAPSGGLNTIRGPAPQAGTSQPGDVYLDSQKVGNVLARKMGNAINKGLGSGLYDLSMALPPTALNR